MIEIDGSFGEGGGQIVRSSLALSIITGKPFKITKVRANREKPGLLNQHLTAVNAAVQISTAETEGVELGSKSFTFKPLDVQPGNYHFNIGTAGSTTLVFQTILPPLMLAGAPSTIRLQGGTHNPMAPPFEFLKDTFLPLLDRMGMKIDARLNEYGFYPKGGGELIFNIAPVAAGENLSPLDAGRKMQPLHVEIRKEINSIEARAVVVNLPPSIAERELKVLKESMKRLDKKEVITRKTGVSPGNVVLLQVLSDQVVETITAIGKRGLPAESVAQQAADETKNYLSSEAAVGEHLADQLLIPMALAGAGSYYTSTISMHTSTNIDVIGKFLDISIKTIQVSDTLWKIEVGSQAGY